MSPIDILIYSAVGFVAFITATMSVVIAVLTVNSLKEMITKVETGKGSGCEDGEGTNEAD